MSRSCDISLLSVFHSGFSLMVPAHLCLCICLLKWLCISPFTDWNRLLKSVIDDFPVCTPTCTYCLPHPSGQPAHSNILNDLKKSKTVVMSWNEMCVNISCRNTQLLLHTLLHWLPRIKITVTRNRILYRRPVIIKLALVPANSVHLLQKRIDLEEGRLIIHTHKPQNSHL